MTNNTNRIAQCSCGAVRVETQREPLSVVACHCVECQRRTGSVFGVGAYFPLAQVKLHGVTTSFSRTTESGSHFTSHFCPTCGTSVYWFAGKIAGHVGVAVGAFNDASFPPPTRSVWEQSMHSWVQIAPAEQHFPKGRGS
jgi:hypothetical protein